MRRTTTALLIALLLGAPALQAQRGDPPRRPFLFKDARGELAAARARGDSAVTLVVAAMPGANARAAQRTLQLGGKIRFRDDDVDYLRIRLAVDSVEKFIADPLVHSADVTISRLSRAFGLANDEQPAGSGFGRSSAPSGHPAPAQDTLKRASKRRVAVAITRPDTRNVNGLRPMENAGRMTYAVLDPSPGVWEVRLQDVDDTRTFDWQQAKKTEAVPNTPVTVTVSALAVEATAATGSNGPSGAADARLTNRLAAFPGAAISLALGSARRDAGSMRGSEQRLYELEVPAGSTWLAARVRSSMADADLDLYAFDCSGKECVAARADGDARGDESVLIANPAAGKWKVVVDASRTGAEGAAFEYEDIIFNPAFGAVSATDQPKERGAGESWVSQVNTWIAGNLPSGRVPYAGLLVQAQPKGGEPFVVSLRELNRVGERASPSPRN
jgi:hypothetical protein